MDSSQNQSDSQSQPMPQPQKNGSSKTTIVVIIVVAILLALAAAGYFAWKYYFKAKLAQNSEEQAAETTSEKIKTLEELFVYPESEIIDKNYGSDAASVMTMETSDKADSAYEHYEKLIELNKWEEGSKGLASDYKSGWLRTEDVDFQSWVNINTEGSKTRIVVYIYSENDEVTTDRKKLEASKSSEESSSSSETSADSDYVISDSNTRLISTSEITSLTPWQLKVARNEIYARRGRAFVHKDLQCYFAKKSWYKENANFSNSLLSAVENKNIATILAYETKINSPLLQKDSGCNAND